jgi:hypothetical protein
MTVRMKDHRKMQYVHHYGAQTEKGWRDIP